MFLRTLFFTIIFLTNFAFAMEDKYRETGKLVIGKARPAATTPQEVYVTTKKTVDEILKSMPELALVSIKDKSQKPVLIYQTRTSFNQEINLKKREAMKTRFAQYYQAALLQYMQNTKVSYELATEYMLTAQGSLQEFIEYSEGKKEKSKY